MAQTPNFDLRDNPLQNFIINGNMDYAQRGTSFAAIANTAYSLDRFCYNKIGSMVHTVTQDSDVPTLAQSGVVSNSSMRLTLTTPNVSPDPVNFCSVRQGIEGYNWAMMAQKAITLSFWVKATLPGVYCVALSNGAADVSIVKEYTINLANTWEKKTITFPASPSAGTWSYTNGVGAYVKWIITAGTNFVTTPDTWQNGTFLSTANQVNGTATGATDFRIAQVMFNIGSEAAPFRRAGDSIGGELVLCNRYFYRLGGPADNANRSLALGQAVSTSAVWFVVPLPQEMRANPSLVLSGTVVSQYSLYTASGSVNSTINSLTIGNGNSDARQTITMVGSVVTSNLAAGSACRLFTQTLNAFIGFDAEL